MSLTLQYRMHRDIMLISNRLAYNDQLVCGNERVATQQLVVNDLPLDPSDPPYLTNIVNPSRIVHFIDTKETSETRVSSGYHNRQEALLVGEMVRALHRQGIALDDMAVITPYRAQVTAVLTALGQHAIETHTVDKYQGRDKDCIFISLVRTTTDNTTSLLSNIQRLTVAMTRAKKKLVVVGSSTFMTSVPILKECLDLLRE
jgi:DNA replication ATP-dependent helicase Dna2